MIPNIASNVDLMIKMFVAFVAAIETILIISANFDIVHYALTLPLSEGQRDVQSATSDFDAPSLVGTLTMSMLGSSPASIRGLSRSPFVNIWNSAAFLFERGDTGQV